MKTFAVTLTLLLCAVWTANGSASQIVVPAVDVPVIQVDWQAPQSLPRRFRNHCASDPFSGRPYCSDHCGSEYQFYFCSRQSFGCCRVGFGYCDWSGLLRCHP
jgi:Tfp pilus assembly protein PilV